jgi:hypothetical protein
MATIDNLSIEISGSADRLVTALDRLEGVLGRLSASAERVHNATQNARDGIQDMTDAAVDAGEVTEQAGEQTGEFARAAEHTGDTARNGASRIAGFWQALRNVGRFAGTAFRAVSFLPRYFGRELTGNIRQSVQGLGTFLASIKRIAMYRLIRTALKEIAKGISEGFKHLYNWSKTADRTFANSMNSIATAAQYMGNSIAAMASPLVNAISPAIDFIADKFVDLFNLINQIIARLSGATSYTAAKKVAAQWDDASKKASGSAKKAADEIKRTILGFDEINKLNDPNKNGGSGGGGSGSGSSGAGMFETRTIDSAVSSFADQLKAAFDASDWQGLGELLGGKVNEIVDSIDFAGTGQKVGYYINAWFSTKYWTLETINFTNIGSKIAEFLNNMIGQIDFNVLGRLMVQKMAIIGDLVIGFFTDFDWGQAAGKLSDFVNGLYEQLTEWFQKYDWSSIGSTLYDKIKDAITNFDFNGTVSNFFTFLGQAAKALIGTGFGFISSLWKDIAAYWEKNIKASTFTETVHNILDAIGQGFSNIGEWVYKNIIHPFVAALTGNDKWDTDLLKFGAAMFDKVKEGWDKVVKLAGNVLQFFVDVKNDVTQWWKNVQTWWLGKKLQVADFVTNVKNEVSTWWNNVVTWWSGKVGKVAEFVTNVKNDVATWWKNVTTWWNGKVGKVQEFITGVKNDVRTWWSNLNTWWNGKVGKVQEFVTNVKNDVRQWWSNVNTWWNGKVGKVQEFTTAVKNEVRSWWGNLNTWWNGKVGKVKEFTTAVKNDVSQWWNNVNTWWNGKVGKAKEFTTAVKNDARTWWSKLNTWWNGKVGKVKEFTTNVANKAKSWWSDVKNWWDIATRGKNVGITATITSTAKKLWEKLQSAWNDIKAAFKIDIKFPKIKLEFVDAGVTSGLFAGIKKPQLSVSWNAKGGIMDDPTLFGMIGNTLQVGGEAGKEALLPLENNTQWMDAVAKNVWSYKMPDAQTSYENMTDIDLSELLSLLRQQNEYLRSINGKDYNVEVSTSSINKAQQRMNRRAGTTIVPVGT